MAMVKVVAAKPIDIRHPNFDDNKPASKENPMSMPVPKGHVFEIPDEGLESLVSNGYVAVWKPEPAADPVEPAADA